MGALTWGNNTEIDYNGKPKVQKMRNHIICDATMESDPGTTTPSRIIKLESVSASENDTSQRRIWALETWRDTP